MMENKFCQKCPQERQCKKVYEILGTKKGPSVVFGVTAAFLVPLAIFITSLGFSERFLAGIVQKKGLGTVLGFLFALGISFISILIIKAVNRRLAKSV